MTVALFTLALFVSVGCNPVDDPKIVGGRNATIEEAPHQVALFRRNKFACGGSILGKKLVLTAAHCLEGDFEYYAVHVGSEYLPDPETVKNVITKYVKHETYDGMTLDHDIGLIFLKNDLVFSDKVKPIALPDQGEELKAGVITTVTGYGRLKQGGPSPSQLQLVEVPIVAHHVCSKSYGSELTGNMICAGYAEGGKDSCQGDSGGPLTASGKVYGVVSWGYGCAKPKLYGVYTKVANYRNWIDKTVKENL